VDVDPVDANGVGRVSVRAEVTYVGLARGYTALGDTRNAIANWEIAIKNIPETQKVNLPVYEQALKALKEKS